MAASKHIIQSLYNTVLKCTRAQIFDSNYISYSYNGTYVMLLEKIRMYEMTNVYSHPSSYIAKQPYFKAILDTSHDLELIKYDTVLIRRGILDSAYFKNTNLHTDKMIVIDIPKLQKHNLLR